MATVISLSRVSMEFPALEGAGTVKALDNIDFDFRSGEFVVALGASGCGKTTLLNVIAGFLTPTSGEILNHGHPITGPGRDRGVVFQKHALLPWLNVVENTEFGLMLQGIPASERRRRAQENLSLVGLSDFQRYPIYQLSGGMQQRVGLARALTCDPDMLLMDEPLGALDAFTRENMQELILRVWKATDKVVFFITHSVEEALFMATRLVVMSPRPGRITHEYSLDFCHRFLEIGDARKIKSSTEFIRMREEILSIIHGEEVDEIADTTAAGGAP
ncbi:taurine ABC transporter ATP-binding protein [Thioalkalivibrio sp. HK1]|uniref:taurine ABC transporter ATP-binding protein n=1 Tax=Thioalkalivibrio sp. HK1 TaxID=1469245 RepID=UPI000470FC28